MCGSVSQRDGFLLIEHPWPFGPRWSGCDRVPEAFKQRIFTYQQIYRETGVGLRLAVAMIRRPSGLPLQDLAFFIAVPDESEAALYAFRLNA